MRRLGRIGKLQEKFNRNMRERWKKTYGHTPDCSVCGAREMGYDVGHIMGREKYPELRFVESSVAPVCSCCNMAMEWNLPFRREAQGHMTAWAGDRGKTHSMDEAPS